MRLEPLHPDSFVGHGDRGPDDDSAVAPPIYQSAPFRASSDEAFAAMSSSARHDRYYTRDGNPTFSRVERLIAGLEGAEAALLTASGMGAISATVLTLVSAGDHVIAQKTHYMGTSQLLGTFLPRFGVSVTLVDQTDSAAFAAAVRPDTRLILLESPANPLLTLTDFAAIADLARRHHILTLCDSTIATPINQRPLASGIDLELRIAGRRGPGSGHRAGTHPAFRGFGARDRFDGGSGSCTCGGGRATGMIVWRSLERREPCTSRS